MPPYRLLKTFLDTCKYGKGIFAAKSSLQCLQDFVDRNDPTTIENSIVTQAVNPEDHHNWLSKILNDASVQLFIVHADKETIGTVRINSTLRDKEISWTIAPNHRGKGYGKTIVNKLVNSLEGTVIAQIKNSNIASKKIAEYAGLKMVSETNDLIKYQLKIS